MEQLRQGISAQVGNERVEVDIVHWMERAALECIGQAGLGYSFDPLTEDTQDALGAAAKAIM